MGLPAMSLSETVCSTMHSIAHGASETRGGRTSRLGTGVSPAARGSSTPRGNGAEVIFMASRRSQLAKLQTNSLVSSMNVTESLRPSLEKQTTGGRLETPVEIRIGGEIDVAVGADRADPSDRPRRDDGFERIVRQAVVVDVRGVEHCASSGSIARHDLGEHGAPAFLGRPHRRADMHESGKALVR